MINKNLSDIELAKRLKEIKGITSSDEDFESILQGLMPKERIDEIYRIIRGLSQEDEFALICKMMECCSSITPLDQTPVLNTNEKTPDFQVTFHPASFFSNMPPHEDFFYKCMVEVKSTDKLIFKTSRSDVKKRKAYAARFGLPLLYAIRFLKADNYAFWVIVTADSLLEKNTVEPSSYVTSLNSILFDNYTLMLNSQFTIIRRYSQNKEGLGLIHKSLGGLQGVSIRNEVGIEYELKPDDAILFAMLFCIMKTYGVYIETYQGESIVYCHFAATQAYTVLDVVYGLSNILVSESDIQKYDPTRAIANMDSPSNPTLVMHRSLLENMIAKVNENCPNFFFFGMLGDEKLHREKLYQLFPEHKPTIDENLLPK